jgi:phosphatidylinositol-3-phosphatase
MKFIKWRSLRIFWLSVSLVIFGSGFFLLTSRNNTLAATPPAESRIKTVFIIVMENHNWSDIQNNPSASYINKTLLPQASFAQQYYNPPGLHPSEPNYLWLEAGTAFGIHSDGTPAHNHQSTQEHLVTYLEKAGISWKAYAERISGDVCPLANSGLYTPRHIPMIFFDNVTNRNDIHSTYCISHIRPFEELEGDLKKDSIARYNFIIPDLCHDMHDQTGCETSDTVKNGDTWLSQQVPLILKSKAYLDGGVLFITWDESEHGEHPIGMIVLSPYAKGGGYSNSIYYTHSATLRTIQEIFGIQPFLGASAESNDLRDMFRTFP